MPELPEVETIRRSLLPHLVGQQFRGVTVRQASLREPVDAAALQRLVTGQRIIGLSRRAKYLLVHLASGHLLAFHLGMTGRLLIASSNRAIEPHDHLIFHLEHGRELRFHDVRRFGRCFVIAAAELASHPRFRRLGIDPLEPECSADYLRARARSVRKPVKNLLMDGTVLSGVGNIYANEALHLAAINPRTPAGRLGRARWERLRTALRRVLEEALCQGGTTFSDFVDGEGRRGYFALALRVYGRQGQPCPRCGRPIRRFVQAGRSTFYCPSCQH
ncbi:MAG: bifunctional DNA-formamidopyrimidine glycosylase/DNA-(apurinic or apyrimidinic site) lyase [Candidatus Tectomicrobia bacterium]|nr:bifunctional DNA-formamidopyrimidine glycosylase/DNA-(apurinic or apyrimidinic site) lyase [Candidatus Tectomicrobia bacterium]